MIAARGDRRSFAPLLAFQAGERGRCSAGTANWHDEMIIADRFPVFNRTGNYMKISVNVLSQRGVSRGRQWRHRFPRHFLEIEGPYSIGCRFTGWSRLA